MLVPGPSDSARAGIHDLLEISMLSLYIHVPFCVRKCYYCGFYSTPYDQLVADDLISAIDRELDSHRDLIRSAGIRSLYLGGGTPTSLDDPQLSRLCSSVHRHADLSEAVEMTVEANPNTLSPSKLALLLDGGANRLSLGVQSFDDDMLSWLGRIHTGEQAKRAFRSARDAGFANISIDLIYGVPGLTMERWYATLESALRLQPDHVSAYALSIDGGSMLQDDVRTGKVALPDDDTVALQYKALVTRLDREGLEQYELANFARPGAECRHNENYWARGEYLGIGPGAWSFLGERRTMNIADIGAYISLLDRSAPFVADAEVLNCAQAAVEVLMLGLRTRKGVDLGRYAARFGASAQDALSERVAALAPTGLYALTDGVLRLTDRGMLLSHDALARIIS